jgi:hypothetical protein
LSVHHVGIDLGTTHTVVAFSGGDTPDGACQVLPVPQLVGAHELEALRLLPSFLYAPAAGESVADPFDELPWLVGRYARHRGQEVTERLIASAKSWLSHAGVARRDGAPTPAKYPKSRPLKPAGGSWHTSGAAGTKRSLNSPCRSRAWS